MPKFRIETTWMVDTTHFIKANSQEEALEEFKETAEFNWRTMDNIDQLSQIVKEINA